MASIPCLAPDTRADGPITPGRTRVVVLGDYGRSGPDEARVARMVHDWQPDFIITTGDNNYPVGAAETIDINIGQYFHDFISPYHGQFGCGARQNRFFPSLGNHDWYTAGAQPYLDYFTLPGNERYYDVVFGDVHLFALDSDPSEPDGVTSNSAQATWLRQTATASRAPWQIAYMHHPPFSSGPHLSTLYMQWPYKEWGIDVVFAGHDHDYERLEVDGLPYIVDGLGGASLYGLSSLLPTSKLYFSETFGAVLVEATATTLNAKFIAVDGRTIDQLTLTASP
jgi:tartrate-resistant acid phosphatase type 5